MNAKDHPVFRELTRVKQYFEKIKHAEFGDAKRENLKLNKPAAGRIVKRALVLSRSGDADEVPWLMNIGWERQIRSEAS